jgi:cytochrome c553
MKAMRVALAVAAVTAWYQPLLAASEPPPGVASCSGCHPIGATTASSVSQLYGRDANDIVNAMAGFRGGSLPSTVMNRIAKGFSDDELQAIAAWLAAQK